MKRDAVSATGTLPTIPPTRTGTPTPQNGGNTATPSATSTSTNTRRPTSISTKTATATATYTQQPTNTRVRESTTKRAPLPTNSVTNTITRTAANIPVPTGTPDTTYRDVTQENVFKPYLESMAARGYISGYPCGSETEPCDDAGRPYFWPGSNITRGQLSKVMALALGLPAPAAGTETFADVPQGSPFHT